MKKILVFILSLLCVSGLFGQHDSINKPIILYFKKWIPETREFEGGLNRSDIAGIPHVKAWVSSTGLVRNVKLVNGSGVEYLSYHLAYNKDRTWAKYWIETLIDTPLTTINDLFIAHDLSDLRRGYRIVVEDRRNGDINKIQVYDNLSSFLYFYEFDYSADSQGNELVTSSYFKYDSTLVGFHQLKYDKSGRLRSIDYFDTNENVKYSLGYKYNPGSNEISRSIIDESGALLEKRILPFSSKYLRRPVRKKQGLSLSEVIDYLEGAKEEEIDALATFLEQRYRLEINRVDTTYSPIFNIIDTLVVEKETAPDQKVIPQKIESTKRKYLTFGTEAGVSLVSGSFFTASIQSLNFYVGMARSTKLLFLPLKPYLDLNIYNISQKNYSGIKMGLAVPGNLPFGIPFELNGGFGYNKAGNEFSAGILLIRQRTMRIGLKIETHIFPDILKSNKSSGWVSAKLVLGL